MPRARRHCGLLPHRRTQPCEHMWRVCCERPCALGAGRSTTACNCGGKMPTMRRMRLWRGDGHCVPLHARALTVRSAHRVCHVTPSAMPRVAFVPQLPGAHRQSASRATDSRCRQGTGAHTTVSHNDLTHMQQPARRGGFDVRLCAASDGAAGRIVRVGFAETIETR